MFATIPPSDELGEERLARDLERIAHDLERLIGASYIIAGLLAAILFALLL